MKKTKSEKTCSHKNIVPGFYKYIKKGEYFFICEDCGKTFITTDPNFNKKEKTNNMI